MTDRRSAVRRVWISCAAAGLTELFASTSIIFYLVTHGAKWTEVLMGITLFTQMIIIPFIISFTIPAFMTMMIKMDMTVEMGRKSLELASVSAESLSQLQSEFVPVLHSLKAGIGNLTELVEKVKHGNGELKDTVRKAVSEARVLIKDGESEIERYVFTKIDQFLAGTFTKEEETHGPV